MPAPQDWILAERLLNPGSPGGGSLGCRALTPKNPAHLSWTAGDIAEIYAQQRGRGGRLSAEHGLDGTLSFGGVATGPILRDIIAHSRLPKSHEVDGISLAWLVERLEGYGPGNIPSPSLPESGRMEFGEEGGEGRRQPGPGLGLADAHQRCGRDHRCACAPTQISSRCQPGTRETARKSSSGRAPVHCGLAGASVLAPEEKAGQGMAVVRRAHPGQRPLLWR